MVHKGLTMAGLSAMVLSLVMIVVLYAIIPMIGSQIEDSVELGATSQWNSSVNSDIPTGVEFWTTNSAFITLTAMMLFIGGFLGTLKGIKG